MILRLVLIMCINVAIIYAAKICQDSDCLESNIESNIEKSKRAIQKDSTLKITPDAYESLEQESIIEPLEFIINYKFKLENDIPYGEKYNISIPINTLNLAKYHNKLHECDIDIQERYVNITYFSRYTDAETKASIKKQAQYLLYNMLQKYKAEVLECLMLHESSIDDINLSINSESRTHTIMTLRSYMLVGFDSGVLHLELYDTLPRSKGENSHSRR